LPLFDRSTTKPDARESVDREDKIVRLLCSNWPHDDRSRFPAPAVFDTYISRIYIWTVF
jgi:hypothetical protein